MQQLKINNSIVNKKIAFFFKIKSLFKNLKRLKKIVGLISLSLLRHMHYIRYFISTGI